MVNSQTSESRPATLTAFLRERFKGVLNSVANVVARWGISPDAVTLAGLVGNIVASFLLGQGKVVAAGWLLLLVWPLDALDGALARLCGKPSSFGGFLDSVTDRYAELIVFGGLLVYYLPQGDPLPIVLTYLAAAGSVLVSYTKARGEALGFRVEGGLLTRVERFLVLVPSLILNRPLIALWLIAILANFTALQRIWIVRRQAFAKNRTPLPPHS